MFEPPVHSRESILLWDSFKFLEEICRVKLKGPSLTAVQSHNVLQIIISSKCSGFLYSILKLPGPPKMPKYVGKHDTWYQFTKRVGKSRIYFLIFNIFVVNGCSPFPTRHTEKWSLWQ